MATEFWALDADNDFMICRARFREGWPETMVAVRDTVVYLPNIKYEDEILPARQSDGFFDGGSGHAWIITDEEREQLLALNTERQRAINAEQQAERDALDAEMAAREEIRNAAQVVRVHRQVMPKGGELGTDGYYDAEIEIGGETVRMVQVDVFDGGVISFPERFKGTPNATTWEGWTDAEKAACQWLVEFGPFGRGIRM